MVSSNTKSYTSSDFYNSYKEYTKESPNYSIPLGKYRAIIEDYFKILADSIIEESKEIKLPARMGSLYVIKKKLKTFIKGSLKIDFGETRKQGSTVYFLNEHSDYFKYGFHWNKYNIITPNHSIYELVMTRRNKRRLAELIKTGQKDYIQI